MQILNLEQYQDEVSYWYNGNMIIKVGLRFLSKHWRSANVSFLLHNFQQICSSI